MGNLSDYAKSEMQRAGLFDEDADYGGAIAHGVMRLIAVLEDEGHSGFSHGMAMAIFNQVANFRPLTPLTDDPSTWMDVAEKTVDHEALWQSTRNPEAFSNDGGKTYYLLDDGDRSTRYTSEPSTL